MTASASLAQALAYVDGCLGPDQKPEFMRRLAADPSLAARVEQWQAQNEAIRRTFDGKRIGAARGEFEVESPAPVRVAPASPPRREFGRRRDSWGEDLRERGPMRTGAASERARRRPFAGRFFRRGAAILVATALGLALSAIPAPIDPSPQSAFVAFSAYRTFAGEPAEFSTAEAAALERWLRPRLGGWVAVPNLRGAGFTLIGGRVIPGAHGPAAFVLYRDGAGTRIGLALESGEAPPKTFTRASGALLAAALAAPSSEQATLVAETGAADLDRVARLARFDPASRR